MGARGGMIAPDETTFAYVKGREFAPKGEEWDKKLAYWKTLKSDEGAVFDKELGFDAADIQPMITYGTNPGMCIRELTGGMYFGRPQGRSEDGNTAYDTCVYTREEVERIIHLAYKYAGQRRKKVTMLPTSQKTEVPSTALFK